jgi:hypothetical protein
MSDEHTTYQLMHSNLYLYVNTPTVVKYRRSTAADIWTISLTVARNMLLSLFSIRKCMLWLHCISLKVLIHYMAEMSSGK